MSQVTTQVAKAPTLTQPVTIPFEMVGNHICVPVRVANATLSFIFDTGDKVGVIDIAKAKELGLQTQGQVAIGGGGENKMMGTFVKDSVFEIPGLAGFSHPILIAMPLANLAPHLGNDFDGIFGADFISQFVIEIDYISKTMTLYDKEKYVYNGPGESIPIKLNGAGHPIVQVQVIQRGHEPVDGTFVMDLGSGLPLLLNKPFVDSNHLILPDQKTFRATVGFGAGGAAVGLVGRIEGLKLGHYKIENPVTVFSQDMKGAFATSSIEGNIGVDIMRKFKVILDYGRSRIIIEPNKNFSEATEYDMSGLSIVANGPNYKEFVVFETLDNTPATEAGIHKGDVITAIDGKPATEFTLDKIHELLDHEGQRDLTIKRVDQVLQIKLKLRRLV